MWNRWWTTTVLAAAVSFTAGCEDDDDLPEIEIEDSEQPEATIEPSTLRIETETLQLEVPSAVETGSDGEGDPRR